MIAILKQNKHFKEISVDIKCVVISYLKLKIRIKSK